MAPADSSRSQASTGRKLEVEVSREGRVLSRIRLRRSPATIGRGTDADVQLDSGHISRLHARIYFDDREITLVDLGSTNGFTVRGRRLKEAKVAVGEAVDVAGFVLVFRSTDRPTSKARAAAKPADDWGSQSEASPVKVAVADGWEEFEEGESEEEPDTAVRRVEEVEAKRPAKPALDPAIPAGSVLNRLVHQQAPSAPAEHARDADDDDDDELENEAPPIDARPLLLALNEEANAQSRANPYGHVAVEVIRVVNENVVGVDTLFEDESSWWGGRPSQLEALWVVADVDRFPIVTHARSGEYRVQVPHDPSWKMFHRGSRPVDLYRSGPFVGCQAEFEDQVEVSCGPFAAYIRCVKVAPAPPLRLRASTFLPSPLFVAAAAVSLILHVGLLLLPVTAKRWNVVPAGTPDYFVALMRPDAVSRDWPTPAGVAKPVGPVTPPVVTPPVKPQPTSEPEPPEPPKLRALEAPVKKLGSAKAQRERRADPKPGAFDGTPPPPVTARPPLKSVSVADFKVSGFLDNLPAPEIDISGRSGMRSGPAALRRAGPLSAGVVTKGPAGMRLTPSGRLTDAQVKAVVSQRADEIERCYNKSLEREPGLAGRVELEWTVDKIGVPANVRAAYDDVGSPSLLKCLRGVVERWVFPPPKGGETRVGFPFIFSNLRR
jgi:hypothetical protein